MARYQGRARHQPPVATTQLPAATGSTVVVAESDAWVSPRFGEHHTPAAPRSAPQLERQLTRKSAIFVGTLLNEATKVGRETLTRAAERLPRAARAAKPVIAARPAPRWCAGDAFSSSPGVVGELLDRAGRPGGAALLGSSRPSVYASPAGGGRRLRPHHLLRIPVPVRPSSAAGGSRIGIRGARIVSGVRKEENAANVMSDLRPPAIDRATNISEVFGPASRAGRSNTAGGTAPRRPRPGDPSVIPRSASMTSSTETRKLGDQPPSLAGAGADSMFVLRSERAEAVPGFSGDLRAASFSSPAAHAGRDRGQRDQTAGGQRAAAVRSDAIRSRARSSARYSERRPDGRLRRPATALVEGTGDLVLEWR
jgi:hypothetical protein